MTARRQVHVHLLPELVPADALAGSIAVVVDVLRASTTIVHALAAGCVAVRPCLEVEEARELARTFPAGTAILGGERHGKPIPGFDLGNSPGDYTAKVCKGRTLVFTTTNGTKAIHRAAGADSILIAGFVNINAVCEQIEHDDRPVHVVCAGADGEVALEDTLVAGAMVHEWLGHSAFDDSGQIAWHCFEHCRDRLDESFRASKGGAGLVRLGYDEDIKQAACWNQFAMVPEVRRDPLRIEVGVWKH